MFPDPPQPPCLTFRSSLPCGCWHRQMSRDQNTTTYRLAPSSKDSYQGRLGGWFDLRLGVQVHAWHILADQKKEAKYGYVFAKGTASLCTYAGIGCDRSPTSNGRPEISVISKELVASSQLIFTKVLPPPPPPSLKPKNETPALALYARR